MAKLQFNIEACEEEASGQDCASQPITTLKLKLFRLPNSIYMPTSLIFNFCLNSCALTPTPSLSVPCAFVKLYDDGAAMYTRWRPVPSARTVRILYQLGYICTGTACGLVTLCLEEQRRRIQILQRVVDNAKVLRQHPRYRGSLALATASEEDYVPTDLDAEALSTPEKRVKRRSRSRLKSGEGNDTATNSDFLPSVVDRAYSGLVDGSRTELGEHVGSSAQRPSISRPGRHATRHISLDRDAPRRKRPAFPTSVSVEQSRKPMQTQRLFESHETDSRHSRTLARIEQVSWTTFDSKTSLPAPSSEPQLLVGGRSLDDSVPESCHSNDESMQTNSTAEDVSPDIERFLREEPNSMKQTSLPVNIAASKLFRKAMQVGSLEDIRMLWLWMSRNGVFTSADAEYICDECGTLSARYDQAVLDVFFASVFTSDCFSFIGSRRQLQMAFTILGRCFSGFKVNSKGFPLLRAVRQLCEKAGAHATLEVLDKICKDLVNTGDSKGAVNLYVLIAIQRTKYAIHQQQLALLDALFEAIAASGALQLCATLLRWKARQTSYEAVLPMINSFIQLCDERNSTGLLVTVFARDSAFKNRLRGWQQLLNDLTPRNRNTLAAVLSTRHTVSEEVYQGLSPSERSTVNKSVMKSLKYGWRSTRNFDEIDRRIRTLNTRLKEIGDQKSLTELDGVAFEIYVSASKMDLAMRTIVRMHKESKTSSLAMCQTAYMFAKQGAWESFSRLLDVMRGWADFRIDGAGMRTFNATLHLYCQHHSAEEILNFVTGIINELGFTPNTSTSAIILEAFVTKQRFDLFAKWTSLISKLENSCQIDSGIVAGLLRRFYVHQRPSHIFMMLLCRKLTVLSPFFASRDLKALVEQSVAYDLRNVSGIHEGWMTLHAKKRLERLGETEQIFIPSPGFAWNQHLYFHDSESTVNVFEPQLQSVIEDVTEQEEDAEESPFDDDVAFEFLRVDESVERVPIHQDQMEDEFTTLGKKKLEGQMWLYISTEEYDRALQLYHETLGAAGIPASPNILELAIEATLRRDGGDKSNALVLMEQAREAGMNTTCANGPLLIHQLRTLNPDEKLDGVGLLNSVIQYYQSNDDNGWRVNHYVGVYAAHTLMMRRQWRTGLSLMSSIYNSEWAQRLPLDIAALTTFLRGYIALQSVEGVQWVVQTILDKNFRISKKFMKQLRYLTRGNYKWMDRHPQSLHPTFDSWLQSCEERQADQRAETHRLGWELVEQIAKFSDDRTNLGDYLPLYVHARSSADASSASEGAEHDDFVDESYYSDESMEEAAEPTKLETLRKRIVEDWNAEQVFRRKMKKAALAQGTQDRQSHLVVRHEDEEGVFDTWKIGSDYDYLTPGTEHESRDERSLNSANDAHSSLEGDIDQSADADEETSSFEPLHGTPAATHANEEGGLDFRQTISEEDDIFPREEDQSSDENGAVNASKPESSSETGLDITQDNIANDDVVRVFDELRNDRQEETAEPTDVFKPFS